MASLLSRVLSEEVETAKAEASKSEAQMVRAIEAAMLARQESAQVQDELIEKFEEEKKAAR